MIKLNSLLNEVLVKNKKTGNVYNVVKMNPQTQEKPTPKDIKKVKDSGDKKPQSKWQQKDKEQKKQFKDLGLDRDKAVKAHLGAKKYAKSKGKKPGPLPYDFTQFLIKTFRNEKMKIDDTTAKFLSKLSKYPEGEMVADTDTGDIQFFLYNGSRYKMKIDINNKSVTTKSIKENTIKLKDLLGEAYNPAESFNKKVSKMTDRNEHSAAAVELAIYMDDRDAVRKLQQIKRDHDKRGSLTTSDQKERDGLVDKLLKKAKKELSDKDYKLINSSF